MRSADLLYWFVTLELWTVAAISLDDDSERSLRPRDRFLTSIATSAYTSESAGPFPTIQGDLAKTSFSYSPLKRNEDGKGTPSANVFQSASETRDGTPAASIVEPLSPNAFGSSTFETLQEYSIQKSPSFSDPTPTLSRAMPDLQSSGPVRATSTIITVSRPRETPEPVSLIQETVPVHGPSSDSINPKATSSIEKRLGQISSAVVPEMDSFVDSPGMSKDGVAMKKIDSLEPKVQVCNIR